MTIGHIGFPSFMVFYYFNDTGCHRCFYKYRFCLFKVTRPSTISYKPWVFRVEISFGSFFKLLKFKFPIHSSIINIYSSLSIINNFFDLSVCVMIIGFECNFLMVFHKLFPGYYSFFIFIKYEFTL